METTNTTKPQERLNPLNDFLFCKIMGEKGSEIQLLGFLNAVLGKTDKDRLISVEILEDRTFTADLIGDKTSVLDVRAILLDGTKVNVEVQLRNLGNMDRRSLFYWSKEYTRSLKAGQDYNELPCAIAINIVNFEYLDAENFHTVFRLREDKEHSLVLTDALEIHFLDMVKWRKSGWKDIKNEPLHRWLTWFDKSSPAEIVEEVINMDTAILEAEKRKAYLSGDEKLIRAYEMREKALSDWVSFQNYTRKQCYTEAHAEGKKERDQFILSLIDQGLSIEELKKRLNNEQ